MPQQKRKKRKALKKEGAKHHNQEVHVNVRIDGDRPRKGKRKAQRRRRPEGDRGGVGGGGPVVATNIQFPAFPSFQQGPMMPGVGQGFGLLSQRVEELRSGFSRMERERQESAFNTPIQTPSPSFVPNSVRPPPSDSPFNQMGAVAGRSLFSNDASMMSEGSASTQQSYFDRGDASMMSDSGAGGRTPPGSGGPGLAQMLGSAYSPFSPPSPIGNRPAEGVGSALSPIRQEIPLSVEEIDSYPTPPSNSSISGRIKSFGKKLLSASKRFNEAMENAQSQAPLNVEEIDSYQTPSRQASSIRSEFPGFSPIIQPISIKGLKQEDFLQDTSRFQKKTPSSPPLLLTDGNTRTPEPAPAVMQTPEAAQRGLSPASTSETPEDRKKRLQKNSFVEEYNRLRNEHPELTPELDAENESIQTLREKVNSIRKETGKYLNKKGQYNPFRPYQLDLDVDPVPRAAKRPGKAFTPAASSSTAALAPGTPAFITPAQPQPKKKSKKST